MDQLDEALARTRLDDLTGLRATTAGPRWRARSRVPGARARARTGARGSDGAGRS